MNHSSSWACRLCHWGLSPDGPLWLSFLGAQAWLLLPSTGFSLLPGSFVPRVAQFCSFTTPLRRAVGVCNHSGRNFYLPGQPLPLDARRESQKYNHRWERGGAVVPGECYEVPIRVFPNIEWWLATCALKLVQPGLPVVSWPSTGTERGAWCHN